MYLVFIKFVEVFTRAAFVVGTSYSLKLSGAGQFGIVATLVGLFAFAFNWERHIDIQRRNVGQPPEVFDRSVAAAVQFWAFNQALMLPVFVCVTIVMAHLDLPQALLAAIIVSGEQVANQSYQMALITARYSRFLLIVTVKNILILAAVLPYIVLAPSRLTLSYVLEIWAIGQGLCALIVLAGWTRIRVPLRHETSFTFRTRILEQHRASLIHFAIGLLAILSLQFDRLTVGSLLPLATTGRYFRHILAVSFVYQFFNVASYNRVVPRIFELAKSGPISALLRIVRRELMIAYLLVAAGLAALFISDWATSYRITEKYGLSLSLILILVASALVRVTADFAALICHSQIRERMVLRAQIISFSAGAVLLVGLTAAFGIQGTAAASLASALIYLSINGANVRLLTERQRHGAA